MKKEVYIIENILDKANEAYEGNYLTYTNFLNLNQLSGFHAIKNQLPPINYLIVGGYEDAERKIIIFYPDYIENIDELVPVKYLKIVSSDLKSKGLTHRDYLGSVLNLGINRDRIGDIICYKDYAIMIVLEDIEAYVKESLCRVKNESVNVEEEFIGGLIDFKPLFKEINGTIPSLRIDNIVKLGFGLSRSNCNDIIAAKRVFINGKIVNKASTIVNENDLISVRKVGKIKLNNIGNITKKGRMFVQIYKYI